MSFSGRRVLIIGAGLSDLAARALGDAALEAVAAESLNGRALQADPPDLVLIDAGGAATEVLAGAIAILGRAPTP
ncbi:MAG TPA: hypothetical protein PLO65_14990, partial [Caulobacter sp.]|nr:hypothetical protein [Caulobacter sp.]